MQIFFQKKYKNPRFFFIFCIFAFKNRALMNKISAFFLVLLTLLTCVGCDNDHANFADHVKTTSYSVMRFRGRYSSSLDGVTLVDTVCVTDYVFASNSTYGDSIVMHYVRLADGAEQWATFGLRNIGVLNEQLSIRTSQVIPWIVRGNETLYLEDLPVSDFSGRYRHNQASDYQDDSLIFTCRVGDYVLRFESGESSIRQ